jgi:hypothetical protein
LANKKEIKIKPQDVALESTLLAIMSSYVNYMTYNDAIDYSRLLPNTQLLLKDYKRYYNQNLELDAAAAVYWHIDWGDFYTLFSQEWHRKDMDENDIAYYRDVVFPMIQKVENADAEACIQGLRQRAFEQRVKETTDCTELKSIIDEYENSRLQSTAVETEGYNINTMDFTLLSKADGIEWVLPSLQASLGSLTAGELTLFVADTNTGKGLLVVAQMVHAFKHLTAKGDERPIMLFNSEGVVVEPVNRFFSNLYRKTYTDGFEEVCQNQLEVNKTFKDTYGRHAEKLWVFSISQINTFEKLRNKVLQYKPAIVFVDIADKLAKERDVGSLTVLYDSLRGLAEEAACPIIATSQSGNTKYFDEEERKFRYKRFLDDKDIYGCKQKASAATTMICMGRDDDRSLTRYINVAKSKRGTPIKLTCEILPKYSRLEELPW